MKFILLAFAISFSQISFSFGDETEICSFDTKEKAISVKPEDFILTYPNPMGNIELPIKVKHFVDQASLNLFRAYVGSSPDLIKDGKCNKYPRDFSGPVFKVIFNETFDLYLYNLSDNMGFTTLYLVFFNEQSNEISEKPFKIYSRWTRDIHEKGENVGDILSFEDFDGDGKKEIRILEKLHNGTYNALVHHYLKNDGNEISCSLALEFLTPVGSPINRSVEIVDENNLKMIVKRTQTEGWPEINEELFLERKDHFSPYLVIENSNVKSTVYSKKSIVGNSCGTLALED